VSGRQFPLRRVPAERVLDPRVQNAQPRMIVELAFTRAPPVNNTRACAAANGPPAQNTRSAKRSISLEQVANAIEIFKQQQLTQGKCPIKQLKEMANTVLDVEKGRMV